MNKTSMGLITILRMQPYLALKVLPIKQISSQVRQMIPRSATTRQVPNKRKFWKSNLLIPEEFWEVNI